MQSIQDFITSRGITMTAEYADSNPNMDDSANMDHWKCVFRGNNRRVLSVAFSMGRGHNGKQPEAADVLDCLASDAAGIENARGFEDWASEYGYDTDSRKVEKTYKVCKRQALKLAAFIGDPGAYQSLLFDTEKL